MLYSLGGRVLLRGWPPSTVKTWGVTAVSLLFGAANVPMLMRHGLSAEGARDVEEPLPPQG